MKQKELDAILDELVKDRSPEEILGEAGLVRQLTKQRMVVHDLKADPRH